ncbi:Hypothetical protein LUCI_0975 [Lucifera butyrica]|uniref:Periplasmic binding protein domain-containing protein n=1 Tax=Lucifera butyrica TaxID=1351585 RepID=A0A498R2S6_9FIRM|nr:sugar ABC transporter substrate-binding protein [Lucifera butyrica]VBB05764.1 Hypothetical protein LUCI_0975 [Lucifera butyrica]
MKRVLALLFVLVFTVSLISGCGSSNSQTGTEKPKKVIGVLLENFSDQWQTYLKDSMAKTAEKLKGDNIEVVFLDGRRDAANQMSQMEQLISRKVDAIVLMPVDNTAAKPMVKEAIKAKIPLISVNRILPNQELVASYVGSDDVFAGQLEAQEMATELSGKGNIIIIEGGYGSLPQIQRKQGYDNILKKYPDIKVIATQTGEWTREKAMKITEDLIQSGMQFDGILAENDEMALGAIKALQDAGRLGKVIVGGIDATPEALKYVKEGELNFTVYQNATAQGSTAIEVAAKLVAGQTVDKKVIIPFELVTKDKVDDYIAKYK